MRTLLRNGSVLVGGGEAPLRQSASEEVRARHTAVAVEGDRIVAVLAEDQAEAWTGADRVVDVAGAVIAPAFVDSHIHIVQTGFTATMLDLAGVLSREALLERVAEFAGQLEPGETLLGQGWDETLWADPALPTQAEFERAAPGRPVVLNRIDGHSALVSAALEAAVGAVGRPLVELDGHGGMGSARVERAAHHAVRDQLAELIGPEQRLAAARKACSDLAAQGVVGFHENAAPHIGPQYEIDLVRQAADEVGLRASVYWGELLAVDAARRLGAVGLAGDLVADGALGSRTAALCADYHDQVGHRGHAYRDADEIAEHFVLCTREGLQAGFHCIGDAALEAIGEGLRRASTIVGADALRRSRHRLEHVEMPSAEVIGTLIEFGVVASVQPMFDRLWGGASRMYAERVGERWRAMNPFAALAHSGSGIAFGSDSPVTPARPWQAIDAAMRHHNRDHALSFATSFAAHTIGGWRAGRDDDSGTVEVGRRADLAVWQGLDLTNPRLDGPTPSLVMALSSGVTIFEDEAR